MTTLTNSNPKMRMKPAMGSPRKKSTDRTICTRQSVDKFTRKRSSLLRTRSQGVTELERSDEKESTTIMMQKSDLIKRAMAST